MAEGDHGEHTRFPCLAMVRYMVATVVTVLTVVVVVMVFIDGLRPVEIRLSIVRGYIRADRLMLVTETVETAGVITPNLGSSYSRYEPADNVSLRVTLSAHNPSGRGSVNCNITTIRVLDMPNAPLFAEMEEIVSVNFTPKQQELFSVPRQTSYTLTKFVTINNTNVLFYIFKRYLSKSSFSALVVVNATISYKPLLSLKEHNISQQHYCWPVTVGYGTLAGTDDVSCKTSEEIDWTVNPQFPAPAPAPAAAVVISN